MNTDHSSRFDAAAWLGLTLVPGVAQSAQRSLLQAFGSPGQVLEESFAAIASVCGTGVATALAQSAGASMVDRALRWLDVDGNHLVALADAAYPAPLLEIHDPPTVLYVRGRLELLNSTCVAIVGSRNATLQGARDAEGFAAKLSEAGVCIVSGLAAGIDAAAHRGGLAHEGSSIAIMGTGADVIYPSANRTLAEQLARDGCIVSEFPLGAPPEKGNFPRRNRVISGLSRGVLVVEAALQSGSLITARRALHQDRDVFAIPGSIHSPLSKGCHDLLKQGAILVENADDILVELRMKRRRDDTPARDGATGDPLLEAMGYAPISMDQITSITGLGPAKLAASLSRLEIDGRIAALAGGLFQRIATPR